MLQFKISVCRLPTGSRASIVAAAGFSVVCWAYAPIGIHVALTRYGPLELAALRFALASMVLGAIVLVRRRLDPIAWKDLGWLCRLACFGVVLHHMALNLGQRSVSAGAASTLAQSTPLFTAWLAARVGGEALNRCQITAMVLAASGAGCVVVSGGPMYASWLGGGAILGAALSWAVYFTLLRTHAHRLDGLSCTCYTVWLGTALLFGLFAATRRGDVEHAWHGSPDADIALLLLGVFPSALAYWSWAHVLRHVPAGRASVALYLVPPAAILLAMALLGERPSPGVIAGMVAILAGVALVARSAPARRARVPSH